jgi:hypothetical protein
MPEFILDHGTPAATRRFKNLDSFTQGYLEAMFFTEAGPDHELEGATLAQLSNEAWLQAESECKDFQELASKSLQMAYAYAPGKYDENRAGNDFWYTRNGHWTGFWDRGLGGLRTDTVGGRLSRDAQSFSSVDVYKGDDGLIYFT